jgi:NDP-hexose C3-ketoreductase / dTDP-4-oxo-2-deoxy-alpha-D-pentos-2-ene 2,3-reductase
VTIGPRIVCSATLCLGTMSFGTQTSEEDSHAILDAARETGVNFLDTANTFGGRPGEGWTEQIIGRWLAQGGGRRDWMVVATKVYGTMGESPNDTFLSARSIRRACDASLKRLQTDYIDVYQMHHVDRGTPWEEIWQAMEILVAQGKILYVSSSNFAGWQIVQAQEAARARHFLGLVSERSIYNLMTRTIELEVIPACEAYGLGLIPWSPLQQGLLAGVLGKGTLTHPTTSKMKLLERHHSQIERYEKVCAKLNHHPAEVGLAWLLSRPAVTAPVVRARTLAQFTSAIQALDIVLDDDTLQQLDEIFPGPGPAPEAYAW